MLAPRVTREQQVARIEFLGEPGDHVRLLSSTTPRFVASDPLRGVCHLEPERTSDAGTLGPDGRLVIGWPVPEQGAGVEERRVHLQAIFTDALGVTTLGTPATVVVLDAAF
jgi:hypothetical protein